MPLDTSIPLQVKSAEFNPLQTALQVAQYRMANAQGNALQQQIGANQAQSQAVIGATDPTTGQVDWSKALTNLAQSPNGAYNTPAFAKQVQDMKSGQVGLDSTTQKLAATHAQVGGQIALGILTNGGTPADFVSGIQQAVQDGRLDPNSAMNSIAHASPTFGDQTAFQGYLKQGLASLPPEIQASLSKPVIGSTNTGGGTQFTATNPLSGQVSPTGYLPTTATVAEQTARVPTFANGQPGTVPASSLMPANLLPPGSQQNGGAPMGNGRYPAPAGAQPAPTQASAPGAGGFVPTGQSPADAAASTVTGTGSANALLADQQSAAGSGARVYQLQAAQQALQNAGSTGPGTDVRNNILSYAQSLAGTGVIPGVDASKIASYDEANKYLTQYASAKAAALGAGTDSKLATTLSANANTHISNLAAQDVVKANIGLERMGQAQQDAWQQSGLPASQYSTWASKFGSTLDPRVFVADQMDPSKVKTMYDKMQPKEQAQFRAQYNWAVQKGYLNGPQ